MHLCGQSMCVVLIADQSSHVSDIHQTFRGNLQTSSDEATTSAVLIEPAALRKRSRSDSELRRNSDQPVTSAELARHNSEDDCWLAVKGKVYDVTGWTVQHPGGRVIATYAGRDATDVFACFHAATSWGQLKQFYVGDLVDPQPVPPLLADFRKMRTQMQQQGLFKCKKGYYLLKLASNFGLLATAVAVFALWRDRTWAYILSACLISLFWQQSGWLAHDFFHHQVFRSKRLNYVMGLLVGTVCLGFSPAWWKAKHNTHHAAPNELDHDCKTPLDPDIDTLPLIAWSVEMLESLPNASHRMLVRAQHYFFFPILLFARLSWCQQSVAHAYGLSKTQKHGWDELACLVVHYGWYLGLVFSQLSLAKGLLFVLLTQMICGFFLSIVFVQSHNGMEVYSTEKDFVTAQVVSTRDIASGIWNDWFTGGLNYQIEHHLFPTLPRHNLAKIQSRVQSLCERHGLLYESCGMRVGTVRVLQRLAHVASHA